MNPGDYELLVAELVEGVRSETTNRELVVGCGKKNRIAGASEYKHQIDVSLEDTRRLFLIECKYWNDRIGVSEVLVLTSRASDIAALQKDKTITPIMVSTQVATRGAVKLAAYFGIALEVAISPSEYGIRIGKVVAVGLKDHLAFGDHAECTALRNGVEIPP